MGIFQSDLGVPSGHKEWLVGDEAQYNLAAYDAGQITELNGWELQVLAQITHPKAEVIFRIEGSDYTGRAALALYNREDLVDTRWDRSDGSALIQSGVGI